MQTFLSINFYLDTGKHWTPVNQTWFWTGYIGNDTLKDFLPLEL